MKKLVAALLFVFCFSLVHAGKEASEDLFAGYPYKSAVWKSKTTVESPQETVSFEQTVYLKNKKMRTEGKFFNRATKEKENQVTIIDGKTMYSINPDKKQGMKYSLNSPNNPAKGDITASKCREKAEKTGSEKINGVNCDKYEYSCLMAAMDIKITEYRNSSGFSVKTVSKMDKTITTVETTDLKVNASVPDSKFVPDKDIKFMDMDSMIGGNMMKMLKEAKKTKAAENDASEKEATNAAADEDEGSEAGQKMMKDLMKNMLGQ